MSPNFILKLCMAIYWTYK